MSLSNIRYVSLLREERGLLLMSSPKVHWQNSAKGVERMMAYKLIPPWESI